uniref:Tyrosine protein kinase-interacting protein n=1 Tax=Saimiriine herpesvirus 2 (strain 484) TaxID=353282 RepID=TIP_SHV48|nr:RecName: Full=Tyrosine protein kinase-interacting protein; Short=Tip; AltName: Full=TipC484 [Saimiriine herpesvirus 2 (strain 484)]CAA67872.1 TipC484 [Saimiriine gammaherpesvirus 2]
MANEGEEIELTEFPETEKERKDEEKLSSCSEETTDTSSSSSSDHVPAPIEVNVIIQNSSRTEDELQNSTKFAVANEGKEIELTGFQGKLSSCSEETTATSSSYSSKQASVCIEENGDNETSTYRPQNVLTNLNSLYTTFEDARAQGKGMVRYKSEDLQSFLEKYPPDYRKPKRDLSATWDPGMPTPALPPRPANLGERQASTVRLHVKESNCKQPRERKANERNIVKDLKRLENKVNAIICLVVVILAVLLLVTVLSILHIGMKS